MNWTAIGDWFIRIVKALHGGPGRFYAYTFGAGSTLIVGAPWWAAIADVVVNSTLRSFQETSTSSEVSEISPWFVAASGLTICLLSMLGFHKAILATAGKNSAAKNRMVRSENGRAEQFSDFCEKVRTRRVGEGDKFGGEIISGMLGCDTHIPRRFLGSSALIIHVIPETALSLNGNGLDLSKLSSQSEILEKIEAWTEHYADFPAYSHNHYPKRFRRSNIEGFLIYNERDDREEYSSFYVQFFENGVVEAVESQLMEAVLHSRTIPGLAVELAIHSLLLPVIEALVAVGHSGRVWISVSILAGLKNVTVSYDRSVSNGKHKIGKQHRLNLPPITFDLGCTSTKLSEKLRSVFDALARAGGWENSPTATQSNSPSEHH